MAKRDRVWFAAVVVAAAANVSPAHAETPAAYCQRTGTDDASRPISESLVPAVNAAFGTHMPANMARASTVFRCDQGHVMVCTTGANLPCGKADTSRTPSTGAVEWCHGNPNASFTPAYATGHATIYTWACHAGAPYVARQVLEVDPRGFVAEYWKALP